MIRRRITEYGQQLQEKQKARQIYGILERQFKTYINKATKARGITGDLLLQLLERRLDNVVYRLGFGDSRSQARQLVRHGHLQVNGRRVDIPSYQVRAGDVVTWREQSTKNEYYKTLAETLGKRPVPGWLTVDRGEVSGMVKALPEASEMDTTLDTRLIVEFYSRR